MNLLHGIITDNDFESLRNILRAGMNPNTADCRGKTLLHIAIFKEEDNTQEIEANLQVVRELIHFGADVNHIDNFGNTPLHFAVCLRKYKIMEILLKSSAGLDIQDDLGNTAMHYAIDNCPLLQWSIPNYQYLGHLSQTDLEAVKLLMNYYPTIDLCNRLSETPLMWAVKRRNLQIIQMLLRNGALYCSRDLFGNEALHYALDRSAIDVDIVTELLRYGSNHASKNNRSESPVDVYLRRLRNALPSEQEKAADLLKLFVFRKNYFKSTQNREIANISRKTKTLLYKFFWYCRFEIEKMKTDEIVKDYTIYEFIARSFYYRIYDDVTHSSGIFAKVLEKLKRGEYVAYIDVIASGICRDYMTAKTVESCYWLDKNDEKLEFLNFDMRYRLCNYLTNFEKLKLMLAFSSTRSFSNICRICNVLSANVEM